MYKGKFDMKPYLLCFLGFSITSIMAIPPTMDKTISPQPTPYKIKKINLLPISNRAHCNTIAPSPNKIKDTYVPLNVSFNKSPTDSSSTNSVVNNKVYSTSANLKILILVEVFLVILLSYLCFRKQLNYEMDDKKFDYDLPLYTKQRMENNSPESLYRRTTSHDKLYNVA
jgi:hypothetical protein